MMFQNKNNSYKPSDLKFIDIQGLKKVDFEDFLAY